MQKNQVSRRRGSFISVILISVEIESFQIKKVTYIVAFNKRRKKCDISWSTLSLVSSDLLVISYNEYLSFMCFSNDKKLISNMSKCQTETRKTIFTIQFYMEMKNNEKNWSYR